MIKVRHQIYLLKQEETELKEQLFDEFENHHMTDLDVCGAHLYAVSPCNYDTINGEALKKDYPSLYAKYSEPHYRIGYLAVKEQH